MNDSIHFFGRAEALERQTYELVVGRIDELARHGPPVLTSEVRHKLKQERETIETLAPLLSLEEIAAVGVLLDLRISEVSERYRVANESNFGIFALLRIRTSLQRIQRRTIQQPPTIELDRESLLEAVLEDAEHGEREFPDSVRAFLEEASQSAFFRPRGMSEISIPQGVPVVFTLEGPGYLSQPSELFLTSGHCFLGIEPGSESTVSYEMLEKTGLLLQDVILYEHVLRTMAAFETAGNDVTLEINLDSGYYAEKLVARQGPPSGHDAALELTAHLAEGPRRSLESRVGKDVVKQDQDQQRTAELEAVLSEDFIAFVSTVYPTYDERRVRSIARLAATYLVGPLLHETRTVAIELAVNVQIPAKVVLPYLEQRGIASLFCFVGLLPLPDIKMAHGVMHFGRQDGGRIGVGSEPTEVFCSIGEMSRNLERPERCFFVRYFLALEDSVPGLVCASDCCNEHVKLVQKSAAQVMSAWEVPEVSDDRIRAIRRLTNTQQRSV